MLGAGALREPRWPLPASFRFARGLPPPAGPAKHGLAPQLSHLAATACPALALRATPKHSVGPAQPGGSLPPLPAMLSQQGEVATTEHSSLWLRIGAGLPPSITTGRVTHTLGLASGPLPRPQVRRKTLAHRARGQARLSGNC